MTNKQDIAPAIMITQHGVYTICSEECEQHRHGFCQMQQYVIKEVDGESRQDGNDKFIQAVCAGVSQCTPWYQKIVSSIYMILHSLLYKRDIWEKNDVEHAAKHFLRQVSPCFKNINKEEEDDNDQ